MKFKIQEYVKDNGDPGLHITFHKGLNALIGENDSGKTAVIDALKLVLLTQSNDYIRPADEDFYNAFGEEAVTEFKIDCTLSDFTPNEAKNFIEYLNIKKDGELLCYYLQLHYRAWKEGHRIFQELRVGDVDDGITIDGKARDLLRAMYLKPLRDARREMSAGRGSRISQILLNHPAIKNAEEHKLFQIFRDANSVYNLKSWEFEELVAEVYSRHGFKAEVTQRTRDGGRDVIATCEVGGISYSTYFECKQQGPRYPVGVEIVRGLYGVMERDRIDKGVIVTTSQFTRDAVREAEMLNGRIKLVDYQELQRLMRR